MPPRKRKEEDEPSEESSEELSDSLSDTGDDEDYVETKKPAAKKKPAAAKKPPAGESKGGVIKLPPLLQMASKMASIDAHALIAALRSWPAAAGQPRPPPPPPPLPPTPAPPPCHPSMHAAKKKATGGTPSKKVKYDPIPSEPTVQPDGWTLHAPTLIYK